MIIVKVFLAAILGFVGLWLWRMAKSWSAENEIPKEWVESTDPKPARRGDPGFDLAIAWQKAMALLAWFFTGLFVVSIGFEIKGSI